MSDCYNEVRAWHTHNPIMMGLSMTVISHVMTMISESTFVKAFNPDIYCLEWIRESLPLYHGEVKSMSTRNYKVRTYQKGTKSSLDAKSAPFLEIPVPLLGGKHKNFFHIFCYNCQLRIFPHVFEVLFLLGWFLHFVIVLCWRFPQHPSSVFLTPWFFLWMPHAHGHILKKMNTILLFLKSPIAIAWRSLRMCTTLTWNSLHRKVWCKWNESVYHEIYAVCEYIISAIHRNTNFMV